MVIDLDGDGFELTGVKDGVYFDNNNSGLSEKTQWVSADDGLLAFDLNSDGFINDGSELFGTSTLMANGSLAKSGFEALSQYDSNNDGVIDEKDEVYSKLLVWQDKNSNGISEADELKSLTIEDVLLSRDSNNLEMQLSGTEDKLIIENYFYSSDYQNFTGSFADGTSLDKDDFTAMLDGTYVYETTFKQSQMLANELASMGIDGNVAASDNYSTVNNANVTDSQIWVTE